MSWLRQTAVGLHVPRVSRQQIIGRNENSAKSYEEHFSGGDQMAVLEVAFLRPTSPEHKEDVVQYSIMRSGSIEFLLCHPNTIIVFDALGILQLIFPALGCIIALVGDVHHEAEDAIGVLYPHPVADLKFGIVLLAVSLAKRSNALRSVMILKGTVRLPGYSTVSLEIDRGRSKSAHL